ncbi:hypothetical protein BC826DRAFT_1030376 [Russula brevipes]|nr:hypothetical protein BC826DRAFT_1030376 [Russula brevipes]
MCIFSTSHTQRHLTHSALFALGHVDQPWARRGLLRSWILGCARSMCFMLARVLRHYLVVPSSTRRSCVQYSRKVAVDA